jgi:hypothetical protein
MLTRRISSMAAPDQAPSDLGKQLGCLDERRGVSSRSRSTAFLERSIAARP